MLLDFVHEAYLTAAQVEPPADLGYLHAQDYLRAHHADHAEYWAQQVKSYEERLNLQGLMTAAALRDGITLAETRRVRHAAEVSFAVRGSEYEAVKRLARECGVTLNALLLYCWHKALHVFSGGRQTATGVVVSGRMLPIDGIERAVGLFINTLLVDSSSTTTAKWSSRRCRRFSAASTS